GNQCLQVTAAKLRIGVRAGDDFALLCDAQPAVHASRRLSKNRFVTGPAAASNGASPSMKQPQLHAVASKCLDERELGAIEGPVRGQISTVLVAVRIAEHDLLKVAVC